MLPGLQSQQGLPMAALFLPTEGNDSVRSSRSSSRSLLSLSSGRNSSIERLATPKFPNPRWLPDRPSVYYLDYLIDETPHKIRDPQELASYYDKFEPKFPRTRSLSAPKPKYDEEQERPATSKNNIPMSALSYKATDRIKNLARPRTAVSSSRSKLGDINATATESARGSASRSRSKLSLPPVVRALSSSGNESSSLDPQQNCKTDLSSGDSFSLKTKLSPRHHHRSRGRPKSEQKKIVRRAHSSSGPGYNKNMNRPPIRSPFSVSAGQQK